MDFSRVLVTDRLAWELFAVAAQEKLLFVRQPDEQQPHTRPGTARQRALSLLVLFDSLILHENGEGTFRLPDLEKEGIVEIIPVRQELYNLPALKTKWGRGAFTRAQLQGLSLIQQFRPLVINRALKSKGDDFSSVMANHLGGSRRKYLNLFFDYVLAVYQGDMKAVGENGLRKVLPPDLLIYIIKEVLEGPDVQAPEIMLSPIHGTVVLALLSALEIASIQSLSTKLGVGVATEYYGEKFRSEPALRGKELDAVAAAHQFLILRAALAYEGSFMPRIEGIKHALLLRSDPHLKAVREQLKLFHSGLTAGDRNALIEARREIQKARRRLARRTGWDRALRCLTYLSAPVGIMESLIWSVPVAGTSLSVIGAAGTAASRSIDKKNEWVLFGT